MRNLYFYFVILLSLISLLCGCKDDALTGNKKLEFDFQIQIQTQKALPPRMMTKSGQTVAEVNIEDVKLLVFENDKYKYMAQGLQITNNSSGKTTFNVRLSSTAQPVTLYIMANSLAEFAGNEPLPEETLNAVKQRFVRELTMIGISGNLSMFGEYRLPDGIDAKTANNISEIRMLRSMARVDIVNANAIPFKLSTIQAFHVADKMQIIPNEITATTQVIEPSIPLGTTYTLNTSEIETTSDNNSISQIYLPESVGVSAGNETEATCIVVGGYYNNSSIISYYKLDFNTIALGHPFGQILRNYRYEFNLTRINREGYATAQEAANNESTGIGAIILWQDYIHNIVFNSKAFFGVSSNHITLEGERNLTETILTETDVSDYTMCWADAMGIPQGTPSTTSIENEYFKVEKTSGGTTIDITTLQDNPIATNVRNIRYVLIEAESLQLLLTLFQESGKDVDGNVIWASSNVDQPKTFALRIQDPGMIYQWNRRVAWSATTDFVTGWNSQGASGNIWEDATDPCPSGWRVPSSQELSQLLNGSLGKKWLSIWNGAEVSGIWLAPTQLEANVATFDKPGNAIFLPAVGNRTQSGELINANTNGYYWADNLEINGVPFWLSLADGTSGIWPTDNRASGGSVRCIKANN